MFDDYTKLVLQDYETKKAAGLLPLNLSKPTPARLRNECLIVCKERFQRKDEKMLRDFFGQADNDTGYLRIIKNCDIDRFRPLINFLKKPTIRTDEKNVELLAWLIDFEPRPDEYDRKHDLRDLGKEKDPENMEIAEKPGIAASADDPANEENITMAFLNPQPVFTKPKYHFRSALIIVILLTLAGLFIYRNTRNEEQPNVMGASLKNREACMYWAGDHYQQISCSQKVYGALVIALDSEKLIHFKKITRPDTITKEDIDNVWYTKIKGSIEFYTADGYHPTELRLHLKPVTDYIFNKYIHPDPE